MATAPAPSTLRRALAALLSLAWPIVLARATQSVIGFSDALMTAPIGEQALAAVTTGALNTFSFIILPMGTVFIVQSFTAQLRGRGETESVRRYAWYGLGIAALAGVISVLAIPLVPILLSGFEYEPEVRTLMGDYLSIRLLSVGAAVAMEALGNWYGGLGNTRPAMVAGLVAMVSNVVGNYLLIEPRFGLPGYGVHGAAWAAVGATVLGLLAIAIPFARSRSENKALNLHAKEMFRVLRFGLPNGVNWFLEFAAFALFINLVVGHMGTTTLAAFNVVLQINSVSFMPAFGMASAGAIMAGEAIGRRNFFDARRFVRLTLGVTVVWMVSVGVVYFTFPSTLMGWFSSEPAETSELIRVGTTMLFLASFWQLFDACGITLSESLRAAGDTTWCMVARILLAWLVFIPVSWLWVVQFQGGVIAVMLTLLGYILLLALAFGWRFLSGRWQDIDLIGEPQVNAEPG